MHQMLYNVSHFWQYSSLNLFFYYWSIIGHRTIYRLSLNIGITNKDVSSDLIL